MQLGRGISEHNINRWMCCSEAGDVTARVFRRVMFDDPAEQDVRRRCIRLNIQCRGSVDDLIEHAA